jgi:hypothetical protein
MHHLDTRLHVGSRVPPGLLSWSAPSETSSQSAASSDDDALLEHLMGDEAASQYGPVMHGLKADDQDTSKPSSHEGGHAEAAPAASVSAE